MACHEGISAHMGEKNMKDKLLRYFFWPHAIRETEEFVKSCDPYQRVGKAGEDKKAPLTLVPLYQSYF